MIDENSIKRLRQLLDRSHRIVVTCHVTPDGDAAGSSLGLARVLSAVGKDVAVVTPDSIPRNLRFIAGAKDAVSFGSHPDYAARLLAEADLVFCLDYNAPSRVDRLAPALEAASAPKVMIDHHEEPAGFCAVTISYPRASSTSLLVFRTLCRLELFDRIDREAAEAILTGMITDTGNFSYNANDPDLYVIIAELLRKGADKDEVYRRACNVMEESAVRLNGYCTSEKMQIFPEHGCALITLDADEKERFGYQKGDTEGLVNKPLAIPQVTWSVYLREDPTQIKVSMRSQGLFPVNLVCKEQFGGGGHLNAAGGEFHGSLRECVDRLMAAMPLYDKYLPSK